MFSIQGGRQYSCRTACRLCAGVLVTLLFVHSIEAATCVNTKTICKADPFPIAQLQAAAAAAATIAAAEKRKQQQSTTTRQLLSNGVEDSVNYFAYVADVLAAFEARYHAHALQPDPAAQHAMHSSVQQLLHWQRGRRGASSTGYLQHVEPGSKQQQGQQPPDGLRDFMQLEHMLSMWAEAFRAGGAGVTHRTLMAVPHNAVPSGTRSHHTSVLAAESTKASPTLAPPPAPAPAPLVTQHPQPAPLLHTALVAAQPLCCRLPPPPAPAPLPHSLGPLTTASPISQTDRPAVKRRRRFKPEKTQQALVSPKITLYLAPHPAPVQSAPLGMQLATAKPAVMAAAGPHRAPAPAALPAAMGQHGSTTTSASDPAVAATRLGKTGVIPAHTPASLPADGKPSAAASRSTAKSATEPAASKLMPSVPAVRGTVRHSPDGVVFVSHSKVTVGIDPSHGGAIMYLSSPALPPSLANMNLVNIWDAGRLIQQSYYGCYDGSCWFDRVWRWNPVQGGSWQHQLPRIIHHHVDESQGSVEVAVHPRNWGGQELLEDVHMSTQLALWEHGVKVCFTMTYTGNASHPAYHQEVPAVYVNRRLGVLATYAGSKPWSNDSLSFMQPGEKGQYCKPTEHWAAYLESKSGYGVGVYSPVGTQLVSYRVGPNGSTARQHCSYFAHIITAKVKPYTQFSYDVYIAVGQIDQLRHWFGQVAATTDTSKLQVQRRVTSNGTLIEE